MKRFLENRNGTKYFGFGLVLVLIELIDFLVKVALFSFQKLPKIFKILRHIKSCDTCMNIKYKWKQKLITQFDCKSQDESFELSYSMFEQCLPNKNESDTGHENKIFWELNKA